MTDAIKKMLEPKTFVADLNSDPPTPYAYYAEDFERLKRGFLMLMVQRDSKLFTDDQFESGGRKFMNAELEKAMLGDSPSTPRSEG